MKSGSDASGVGTPESSGELQGTLGSLATLLASFQAAASKAAPLVKEFAAAAASAAERVEHWEEHATTVLKGAVKASGLIVPVSQLSFPEIVELLTVHERDGDEAVVGRLQDHYNEIFGQEGFLQSLLRSWQTSGLFQRRVRLLGEALRAHELGMYGVAIPTLLAQFEGLVIEIQGHTGETKYSQVKSFVAGLGRDEGSLGDMLSYFVNETLLAKFFHGFTAPPFSRHAILHGVDVNYATETNSRTAILLLDYLKVICEDEGP